MSESKRTPGEWHRHGLEIHVQSPIAHYCVCVVNDALIAKTAVATGDFIVRACNAHDALVEALATISARMENTNRNTPISEMGDIAELARAALALAEGGAE
jgi:hypothetical protein